MLIEFTVGNFLSFYDKKTINFEASGISELKNNIIKAHRLLPSCVVYGANSSGKSNLIDAFALMKDIVLSSVKLNVSEELNYLPFLLLEGSDKEPTFFEMIFIVDNVKYRYGFTYNSTVIQSEWLFTLGKKKQQQPLFVREFDGIGIAQSFSEGLGKEAITNDNRLFLSLVAQLGGGISKKIINWFSYGFNVLSGIEHSDYKGYTNRMLHNKSMGCDESLQLFKLLNLGFTELRAVESDFDPSDLPDDISKSLRNQILKRLTGSKQVKLQAVHDKYDRNGNVIGTVEWDRDSRESEGTNKLIDLSGPIFDTLLDGKVLIVDELDAKLHPLITTHIVNLFNDADVNKKNAQLIFVTHDTNLLSSGLFRRDQIWFAEKDNRQQTDLYSLYDFNLPDGSKVRNDGNYERNYIRGRYGAIPFIEN